MDGVEELLAIASQHSIPLETGKSLSPPKPANPLIVVEGMDAAGCLSGIGELEFNYLTVIHNIQVKVHLLKASQHL